MDNTNNYSAEVLPYLTIQATFKDALYSVKERIPMSTNLLSLTCQDYEKSHLYFCAQYLHLYTACIYTGSKDPFVNIFHLRKAIELGVAHGLYRVLAVHYAYLKPAFDEVLKDYDPAIRDRIISWSQFFDSNIIAFLGNTASSVKTITELSEEQLLLMTLAAQGLTNKEVAQVTGIPEYTIRRRYEALFNKYNVSKKKQLAALFLEAYTDGYNNIN